MTTGVLSSQPQSANPLVGGWRMLSWTEEDVESNAVQNVFGDSPVGMLIYALDGHMSVFIAHPKRKPSVNPKATDAEGADLYRTMLAYSGTYSIDGNQVTHQIEVSWNQSWSGTKQQRTFEVQGDILTIKTEPTISPVNGKKIVAALVWKRIE